jgi:hypothetical protein
VTCVELNHHPDKDISLDPANPTSLRARPVRHLLEDQDAEIAIDGTYRKAPGDIVDWPEGSYLDPGSEICAECERAAAEAS